MYLAAGALQYVGGQVMKRAMGGDGGGPSNAEVIAAIKAATEEIKRHVSAEVRAAITEDHVRQLDACCESTFGKLMTYSGIEPSDRPRYIHLLTNADTSSRDGIALAGKLGAVGLPAYASLVSMQILVAKSFFDIDGKSYIYKQFVPILRIHTQYIMNGASTYIDSLSPYVRMGTFNCSAKETGGGGFPTREFRCGITVDGQPAVEVGGLSNGPSGDEYYREQANAAKLKKGDELLEFQKKMNTDFAKPMYETANLWGQTANLIESDGKRKLSQIPTPPPK
ncbi:hypothetical protein E0H47_31650 [Rhizobium leguminosarum bv. viciae]|uniref:hypothetical protein n=1 Tax=Rhizobium leguminosarum TaxID=384 RepID=UPI00103BCDCD|nr:hypothetical protein [Rhizobium leguminosarum]TBZ30959.1 hypothetical protein E0H47_31650 [Rhizobium leguminosarum bv. viciae]